MREFSHFGQIRALEHSCITQKFSLIQTFVRKYFVVVVYDLCVYFVSGKYVQPNNDNNGTQTACFDNARAFVPITDYDSQA